MRRHRFVKALNLFIAILFGFQQIVWSAPVNFDVLLSGASQSRPFSSSILGYLPTCYISGIRLSKDGLIDILWEKAEKGARPSQKEKSMNVKFFLSALALPDDSLWVNLNAGLRDTQILGQGLNYLELGKVFLAADVELKKDVKQVFVDSGFLDEVLDEAGAGGDFEWQVAPRFWIVPGRIEIVENDSEMVINRCDLKVMADVRGAGEFSDFIKSRVDWMVVPELERIVNGDERYMPLRQAVRAIVAAMWYEKRMKGKDGVFSQIIDKGIINGLKAAPWSRRQFLDEYLRLYKLGAIEGGWDDFEVIGGGVAVTPSVVENATTSVVSDNPVNMAGKDLADKTKIAPKQEAADIDLATLSEKVSVGRTIDGVINLKAKEDISTEELVASAISAMGYAPEGYRDVFEQGKVGDFLNKLNIKSGQTIGGFSKGAEVAFNEEALSRFLDELGIAKKAPAADKTISGIGAGVMPSIVALFAFAILFSGVANAGGVANGAQELLSNVKVAFDDNSLVLHFPQHPDKADAKIGLMNLLKQLQNMGLYVDTNDVWNNISYNPDTGDLTIPSKWLKKLLGRGIFSRVFHPARKTLPQKEAKDVLSWIVNTINTKGSIYFRGGNLVISPGSFTGEDVPVLRLLAEWLAKNEMVKSGRLSYASADDIYKKLLVVLHDVGNKTVTISPEGFKKLTGLKLKGLDPKKLRQWNSFMNDLSNPSSRTNALSIKQAVFAELAKNLPQFSMRMTKDGLSIISNKGVVNADTASHAAGVIANIFNLLRLNGVDAPQVSQADIVKLLLDNNGELPESFWNNMPGGAREKVFQYFTILKHHTTFNFKIDGQKLSSSITIKSWKKLNPQERDAVRQLLAEWMYRHNIFGYFRVYENGAEMPRDITLPEWRRFLETTIDDAGKFTFKDIVTAGSKEGLNIDVNYLNKSGVERLNTEFKQINDVSNDVNNVHVKQRMNGIVERRGNGPDDIKSQKENGESKESNATNTSAPSQSSAPKVGIVTAKGYIPKGSSLSRLIEEFIKGLKTQAGISQSAGKGVFWELWQKLLENHGGDFILWAGRRFSLTSEDLRAITEFMNNRLPKADGRDWTLAEVKNAFENFDVSGVKSKVIAGETGTEHGPTGQAVVMVKTRAQLEKLTLKDTTEGQVIRAMLNAIADNGYSFKPGVSAKVSPEDLMSQFVKGRRDAIEVDLKSLAGQLTTKGGKPVTPEDLSKAIDDVMKEMVKEQNKKLTPVSSTNTNLIIPERGSLYSGLLMDLSKMSLHEIESSLQGVKFTFPQEISDAPEESSSPWLYGGFAAGGTVAVAAGSWGVSNLRGGKQSKTDSSTARAGKSNVISVNQAADGKWQISIVDVDGSEKVLAAEDIIGRSRDKERYKELLNDIEELISGDEGKLLRFLISAHRGDENTNVILFERENANLFGFYKEIKDKDGQSQRAIGLDKELFYSQRENPKYKALQALLAHELLEGGLSSGWGVEIGEESSFVRLSYKEAKGLARGVSVAFTIQVTDPSVKVFLKEAQKYKRGSDKYKHYIARAIVRQSMPEADRLLSGYIADKVGDNLKEKLDNLLYDEGLDELPVAGEVSPSELSMRGEARDMLQGLISAIKENKVNDFILDNIATDTSEQFDSDVSEIMRRFNSKEINEQEAAFLILDAVSRHSIMPDIAADDYAQEKADNRETMMKSIRVVLFNVAGGGDIAQDNVASPQLNYSRISKVMAVRSELIQSQPGFMGSKVNPATEKETGGIMLAAMSLVTVPM